MSHNFFLFFSYPYLLRRYLFTEADRSTISEKRAEAFEKIEFNLKNKLFKTLRGNYQLEIIVRKVCIETWFLGNRNLLPRNRQVNKILSKYIEYFHLRLSDTEDLANGLEQNEGNTKEILGYKTKALFHEGYLREIFKERNLSYSKSRQKEVPEES